ncbi:FAD:protein FMN transferase, partial [Phaeovulum sp.]|uniref:FAD:protein FMN transferase n=1 Tax=Phaeovulum sp. TaxID=2934796 RepID=UPI003568FAC0
GDWRNRVRLGAGWVGHSMHPTRAAPVQNGVAAVSVLAPDCTEADAWATALMVLGPEAGVNLARARRMDALFQVRGAQGIARVGTGCFA